MAHSNSASRSSEDGARGGCDPADEEEDGGVARSSPSAGASKYDSSSIGSTLVSGKSCKENTTMLLLLLWTVQIKMSLIKLDKTFFFIVKPL